MARPNRDLQNRGADVAADAAPESTNNGTSFFASTHPWGNDIRAGDLRVLAIGGLILGVLSTASVIVVFFASGLFDVATMNYYVAGKFGGGTFEADTRVFAAIGLAVTSASLVCGIVAVVMLRRSTRGVYPVAIASVFLATLVAPFFIGNGISAIVGGPGFDGDESWLYAIPSISGLLLGPVAAVLCGVIAHAYNTRIRRLEN